MKKRVSITAVLLAVLIAVAMIPQTAGAASKGTTGFSKKPSTQAEKIVKIAKSKRGCRYVYGASGPYRFDCSGFVAYCMKKSGISFRRGSAASYNKRGYNVGSNIKNAQKGDIILYSYGRGGRIGHCAIYIGGKKVIHATTRGVRITGYGNFGQRVAGIIRTYTPAGSVKIQVKDPKVKVAGTKYKVTGSGTSKTVSANSKGEVTVSGLKAGSYKVQPVSLDKAYISKMTKSVKIKANVTSTVRFTNIFTNVDAMKAKAAAKAKPENKTGTDSKVTGGRTDTGNKDTDNKDKEKEKDKDGSGKDKAPLIKEDTGKEAKTSADAA